MQRKHSAKQTVKRTPFYVLWMLKQESRVSLGSTSGGNVPTSNSWFFTALWISIED